eukprot:s5622_g6.t1
MMRGVTFMPSEPPLVWAQEIGSVASIPALAFFRFSEERDRPTAVASPLAGESDQLHSAPVLASPPALPEVPQAPPLEGETSSGSGEDLGTPEEITFLCAESSYILHAGVAGAGHPDLGTARAGRLIPSKEKEKGEKVEKKVEEDPPSIPKDADKSDKSVSSAETQKDATPPNAGPSIPVDTAPAAAADPSISPPSTTTLPSVRKPNIDPVADPAFLEHKPEGTACKALARDGTMARPPDTSAALSAFLGEQQEEERPAEEDPMLDLDLSDDADATYAAFSSPPRADIGDMPPATEDASWSSLGFSDSTEDGLGRERQTRD